MNLLNKNVNMTNLERAQMQPDKYAVAVLETRDETPSTRSIRLSKPSGFEFRTSQAVRLVLNGEKGEIYHPLSIASSPTKPYLEFAVRRSDSEFKRAFLALRPGDTIHIIGPRGSFFLDTERPAVLLAGGIGITPLKSMIEYATDMNLPTDLTLVYSNRTVDEIAFKQELDALEKMNNRLTVIHTLTRHSGEAVWEGRTGRIDHALLREIALTKPDAIYYICGTPTMVNDAIQMLLALGVPAERILQETFKGYARHVRV